MPKSAAHDAAESVHGALAAMTDVYGRVLQAVCGENLSLRAKAAIAGAFDEKLAEAEKLVAKQAARIAELEEQVRKGEAELAKANKNHEEFASLDGPSKAWVVYEDEASEDHVWLETTPVRAAAIVEALGKMVEENVEFPEPNVRDLVDVLGRAAIVRETRRRSERRTAVSDA